MTVRVNIDISTSKIVATRGLDGPAQRKFTHAVRRLCDPYVPMDTGTLKNSAQEHEDRIEYITPYAASNYYGNRGRGQRGPYWDKRMLAEKKAQLLAETAKIVGGKVK